jgi:hypothetical protein
MPLLQRHTDTPPPPYRGSLSTAVHLLVTTGLLSMESIRAAHVSPPSMRPGKMMQCIVHLAVYDTILYSVTNRKPGEGGGRPKLQLPVWA